MSCSAATTAGVASKARTRSVTPAVRIGLRRCRRSRSTAARSGSRRRAASSTAAARFPICKAATCSAISAATCGRSRATTQPTMTMGAGLATGLQIVSFGQDVDGEAYIVHLGGTLHKIVPGTGGGGQIPNQLSATGCVSAAAPTQPASGLIPYAPSAPFFSDNAVKTRWLALPNGQRMVVETDGDFDVPARQRAREEFPPGLDAHRDAALHATQQRQLGGLYLRVERAGYRRNASGRRQDRHGEWPDVGVSRARRNACNATTRPQAARWASRSARSTRDFGYPRRTHGEPAHDA